jgi:hypothetical protein
MSFLTFEDETAIYETVIFPKVYDSILVSSGGVAGAGSPRREGSRKPAGLEAGERLLPRILIFIAESIKSIKLIKKNGIHHRKH